MRYHNITRDDMLNGDGLRAVLWLAGCSHACPGCQNPITHDPEGGLPFNGAAKDELFALLSEPYIAGLTLSGGDPLYPPNRAEATELAKDFRARFHEKTLWVYTGFLWEEVRGLELMRYADVLVDGPYVEALRDTQLFWRGSSNQRVIDVQASLTCSKVKLHCE